MDFASKDKALLKNQEAQRVNFEENQVFQKYTGIYYQSQDTRGAYEEVVDRISQAMPQPFGKSIRKLNEQEETGRLMDYHNSIITSYEEMVSGYKDELKGTRDSLKSLTKQEDIDEANEMISYFEEKIAEYESRIAASTEELKHLIENASQGKFATSEDDPFSVTKAEARLANQQQQQNNEQNVGPELILEEPRHQDQQQAAEEQEEQKREQQDQQLKMLYGPEVVEEFNRIKQEIEQQKQAGAPKKLEKLKVKDYYQFMPEQYNAFEKARPYKFYAEWMERLLKLPMELIRPVMDDLISQTRYAEDIRFDIKKARKQGYQYVNTLYAEDNGMEFDVAINVIDELDFCLRKVMLYRDAYENREKFSEERLLSYRQQMIFDRSEEAKQKDEAEIQKRKEDFERELAAYEQEQNQKIEAYEEEDKMREANELAPMKKRAKDSIDLEIESFIMKETVKIEEWEDEELETFQFTPIREKKADLKMQWETIAEECQKMTESLAQSLMDMVTKSNNMRSSGHDTQAFAGLDQIYDLYQKSLAQRGSMRLF